MDFLARFSRRDFVILTSLAMVTVLAGLVTFAIKPAWQSYSTIARSRDVLQRAVKGGQELDATIVKLQAETRNLRSRIYGDIVRLPVSEMEAYVMGKLQQISWNHNVELAGVTPGEGESIDIFKGFVFEVQINASFFDLVNWLGEIQRNLGFAVLERFTITPVDQDQEDPMLNVRVMITSYRVAS